MSQHPLRGQAVRQHPQCQQGWARRLRAHTPGGTGSDTGGDGRTPCYVVTQSCRRHDRIGFRAWLCRFGAGARWPASSRFRFLLAHACMPDFARLCMHACCCVPDDAQGLLCASGSTRTHARTQLALTTTLGTPGYPRVHACALAVHPEHARIQGGSVARCVA